MKKDNQQLKQILNDYSAANCGRSTRLGVISNEGPVRHDYWLSNGLPLIDVSFDDGPQPALMIRVGQLCHSVNEPMKISIIYTRDHSEDGIDAQDKNGDTTILRFEN